MRFKLPPEIARLIKAPNSLRKRYDEFELKFTLDGKLVGDLGEVIAAELFGLTLTGSNSRGIDARADDGRTVQVKATGTWLGPAFRVVPERADHLIFLEMDFKNGTVEVVFNGPEEIALAGFPDSWTNGQRSLTRKQIRDADKRVKDADRLKARVTALSV